MFGVVARVLGDETTLAGEHADRALIADLEEMLGVAVGQIDALAVEVLVEVLDLLVAGKEHETAGAARGGHVVIEVELDGLGHDVSGNAHVLTGNLGHRGNPFVFGGGARVCLGARRFNALPIIVPRERGNMCSFWCRK